MTEQIRTSLGIDGVLLATIDMPGRTMNVFSVALMDALDALMDRVEADPAVRSVVVTSGKAAFLAGADLDMVRGYTVSARSLNREQLFALCGRLGRQFVRLEASAKPWVAAVNGIALGGGLELAMACRARVTGNDSRIQLGLPEVRWGLLPGAGGTQRLPRLVGFELGLSLLLSGRSMSPGEAVRTGLFSAAAPAGRLLDEARTLALRLQDIPYRPDDKLTYLAQADVPEHSESAVLALADHHGVSRDDLRNYPAYRVIIDCVLLGARKPLAEATAVEMQQFLRLMVDPVAGNMIRTLFLNRQRADREAAPPRGLRVQSLSLGPLSTELSPWRDALRSTGIGLHEDASLPPDSLLLTDSQGATHAVQLGTLDAAPTTGITSAARAVLSPSGPYGRVLEILKATPAQADALASLAQRLGGALPLRSANGASLLARLAQAGQASLDEQAVLAIQLLAEGAAREPALLDVAACAAGVTPAWTGGPLTHLWAHRQRLMPQLDAKTRDRWPALEPVLQAAYE
jgi:3-hydroxyacyl-CoA dehydrogenase / enoyl-CoA hydratase / 3-hydroxybutyryl-CoA epimerase